MIKPKDEQEVEECEGWGAVEGPCSMTSSLCPNDAEMYGVSRALCSLKS
jgi:hypothetical protein